MKGLTITQPTAMQLSTEDRTPSGVYHTRLIHEYCT